MNPIQNRIYEAFDTEMEKAIKDDEIYDALISERDTKVAFELGAKYMLKVFSREPRRKYKQGATETIQDYVKRLEGDIVELQCSNAGWLYSFKGHYPED